MIPLHDNVPPSRRPIVNYVFMGICAVVFLLQLATPGNLVEELGMVPARVLNPDLSLSFRVDRFNIHDVAPASVPNWLTLLTCIFLHGGWMHFLGNMWFLYIFGDNVEDRFGKLGYVAFYLASGVIASLTHMFTNADSPIPTIGASGAVAGVMGAYMLLYPKARVMTLVPLGFILTTMALPAYVFLGIWLALQFFNVLSAGAGATGVAWWAHIGGFALGIGLVPLLRRMGKLQPPVERIRPGSDHFLHRIRRGRF